MSARAVEVVRELTAALNTGDFERVSTLFDPEVVQYGTRGGIDQDRVFHGREAVLRYWDEVGEVWESQHYEPERLVEGDDVIVAFWRETSRSRHSDLEVESRTASVFKLRNGKVVELRGYMDRAEALEAAGLTER